MIRNESQHDSNFDLFFSFYAMQQSGGINNYCILRNE